MRSFSPLLLLTPTLLAASTLAAEPAPLLAALKTNPPTVNPPAAAAPARPAVAKPAEAIAPIPNFKAAELPQDGSVRVEILELAGGTPKDAKGVLGLDASWTAVPNEKTYEYREPAFAFGTLPLKYNAQGLRVDRTIPYLVRAAAVVTFPAGENKLLLRSLTGARLAVDGQQVATTPHGKAKYGDNEEVPDQAKQMLVPGVRLLPPGHKEAMATITGDGQPHVVTLEAFVGGKVIRPEVGELSVAVAGADGKFRLLLPGNLPAGAEFNDAGWHKFAAAQQARVEGLNDQLRQNDAEAQYWQRRHELARQNGKAAPTVPGEPSQGSEIERFLAQHYAAKNVTPTPRVDDAGFLRRATLDTIGLLPTPAEVQSFLADAAPDKRAKAIDRLLADKRWADRWTSYWQDVLAENPALLKGTLNNTGPFRYWIHEALRDNKPFDRFVTELILMEGSEQYGGPAGFAVASQNDLPMAAKGQIIASAFLGMEMKCARCHDAPNHPFDQAQLFNLAAMLGRAPVIVPTTSLTQGLSENSHVTVSLKAGQSIPAQWPFPELKEEPLPGVLRRQNDSRELLAAVLTDPRKNRMAQVVVNRLWKELMGVGIVDPVEDWENTVPSHPELLAWLAADFIQHGYDLKHSMRTIMLSEAYQRVPSAAGSKTDREERTFASPARRRLSAEQLVDTLSQVAGKGLDCEPLTMDPENRQPAKDHTNLGQPQRAWELAGGSNERDRPALAKPRAQVLTDVLTTFGWRDSRAEPRSTRDQAANVLQPALMANGSFGGRMVRLSEDSAFTALALQELTPEQMAEQLYLRLLSRPPTTAEKSRVAELLAPGFGERRTGAAPAAPRPQVTQAVSWANHLHPEATRVVMRMEEAVRAGDPPTARLTPAWRERMEDAVWALTLSPEFLYLP